MYDIFIRVAADGLMIPIVMIGVYALVFKVPKEERLQVYSRVLVAGLTTYLLAKLIGYVYQPETLRPFELASGVAKASYLNNPGFPSDHILFATAIVSAVWFETKQKFLTWILIVLIILVAVGRVLALVHTPLDVIGGAVIAAIGSVWYLTAKS
ncbi:phosphatase PAP2 family protein [Candidatus Saccharibacteria bacterium]|nr:phosphatase PAP2 family protein [Candidatus Saccharibacteria bacterium]